MAWPGRSTRPMAGWPGFQRLTTAMTQTFKLTIEYDGTRFSGWQRQAGQATIQGELEQVLSRILNQPITLAGSGRTDAGVHAWGQVASFCADTDMPSPVLKKGVNSLMKFPIVLTECVRVPDDFHAQYSAVSKEYNYYILNRDTPCAVARDYVWHIPVSLDLDVMNQCCQLLKGTHDFTSFVSSGWPETPILRLFRGRCLTKFPIVGPPAITNRGKCFHISRFLTTFPFFGHTCSV
jgi:tRNA pseudouridine38-40 synthase